MPPASQIEDIHIRDLPNAGNTWALRAFLGRAGKSKVPSWVVVMAVLSGRITVEPVVVGIVLSKGESAHKQLPVVPESAMVKLGLLKYAANKKICTS